MGREIQTDRKEKIRLNCCICTSIYFQPWFWNLCFRDKILDFFLMPLKILLEIIFTYYSLHEKPAQCHNPENKRSSLNGFAMLFSKQNNCLRKYSYLMILSWESKIRMSLFLFWNSSCSVAGRSCFKK